MRYLTFAESATYPICLLVPQIRRDEIQKAYLAPHGVDPNEVLAIELHFAEGKKKTPVAEIKAWIEQELLETLNSCQVEYLLVADSEYFKVLTKSVKVDVNLGYVLDLDRAFETEHPVRVIYVPNYRQIFYDPDKVRSKIAQGIEAMQTHRAGGYQAPGSEIVHFADYPNTADAIEAWLVRFLEWNRPLSCDIEGFGLKHHTAGIGTISFAWNEHEGIAFAVDLIGEDEEAKYIRAMLKEFFTQFKNKIIWHPASFDVYILIFQLFMEHILDTEGLLKGMEVMLRDGGWEDTRLIAYLATNSCAGNRLGLKDQAQEFAGNWAKEDIKDIRKIPLPELLQYNLVDALSTWFVYKKHWDTLVADQQLEVYRDLFQPAVKDIVQMQLTGLPLDMNQVLLVRTALQGIFDDALGRIQASPLVQRFVYHLREEHVRKRNAELKKKRITLDDPETLEVAFNPNSGPQLQVLLYEMIGLPVIARTDTKQPAVGGKTLEALVNHTQDPDVIAFLRAMIDYGAVYKLLTAFIPNMEAAALGPDGWHYLFGNFNLGGTVSGRLSSSDPNLQNLPANVFMTLSADLLERFRDVLAPYVKKGKLSLGKLIKSCFSAPPGWVFSGLDFASLEDRISAVTTKDPNKLKVYTDGYDGHSLRAFTYYGEEMPDIVETVESINSIQDKYKDFRQESKTPTFLLTYQGTWMGIVGQCGFTPEKAKKIEARYHELYQVSDQWVSAKLDEACRTGYVTIAFGMRLRTPLLKQVIRGTSKTPYEAEAEGRTAGNALGQSWCLLNSRAGSEFMGKVRQSKFRLDIRPCAQIHDAGYFLIREDVEALLYANEHLVKAVQWQDHPDIMHDEVKLGGEFSIFYPDWSQEIAIPNGASEGELLAAIDEHVSKLTH